MNLTENKTNQHTTPEFYLDLFSYTEGVRKPHVNVYDKKLNKHFSNSTDNVGYIKDFYTINIIEDKYVWDDFYTYDVEPKMAPMIRRANQIASCMVINNETNIITPEEKKKLALLIAIQYMRGRKFIEFMSSAYDIPDNVVRALSGASFKEDEETKKAYIAETVTSSRFISPFTMHIHNRSWIFYYTPDDRFITSDEPITLYDAYSEKQGMFKCGIADPRTVICFPLSSRVLLVMYHPTFKEGIFNAYDKKRVILEIEELIKKHNAGQYLQSKRFIYGSTKALLRKVVNTFK